MVSFDLEKFASMKGEGQGLLDSVGSSFGVPSCLMNLAKDALGALPMGMLQDILGSAKEGKADALDYINEITEDFFLKSGILQMASEGGVWKFISDSLAWGFDDDKLKGLDDIGKWLGYVDAVVELGGELYKNLSFAWEQIKDMKECISGYMDFLSMDEGVPGPPPNKDAEEFKEFLDNEFADVQQQRLGAEAFIIDADRLISDVQSIIKERQANPNLEPIFFDVPEIAGSDFPTQLPEDLEEAESLFDLVFGPPKSTEGQFLLTADGLYYDSQSGGLDPAFIELSGLSAQIPVEEKWKFDQDPAIGGKGVHVSLDDITSYIDTLFDPDIIDDSLNIQEYYDEDHFLQHLIGEKNREVYDLSSHITDLIAGGNDADSAIVINMRQSLYSIISRYSDQIRRRKKQIEIAAKAPLILDPKNTVDTKFVPGNIPINDFSYLADYNVVPALEKQEKLVFETADVQGMVLPIQPKFVVAPNPRDGFIPGHLMVPTVGKGDIVYSSSSVSGSEAFVLNLTDDIVTDKLIAVYNFLQTDVESPSSTKFQVLNCADINISANAQIVASDSSSVFFSGLGIPFFEGIGEYASTPQYPSSVGSFGKLPDTEDFRNLTYSPDGFTIESWVHVPTLTTSGQTGWNLTGGNTITNSSSLHRLILGSETTGGTVSSYDETLILPSFGTEVTRGMLLGFTIDKQIVSYTEPSNDPKANAALSDINFYIAPTQSAGFSSVGFTRNIDSGCFSGIQYHGVSVPASAVAANGSSTIGAVSGGFVLVTTVIDPINDKVNIYADGSLVVTSGLVSSLGADSLKSLNLPTFTSTSSFEYGGSAFCTYYGNVPDFNGGPKFNTSTNYSFVPWIIGGGYTDLLDAKDSTLDYGGFMGNYHGRKSGLRGHLGSLKFYKKPLNNTEVLKNFTAQKGFFKNIEV